MRHGIGFLLRGALRSRFGVALALALLVLVVIGVARLVAGPSASPTLLTGAPREPLISETPIRPDDGLHAPLAPVSPTVIPGALRPEAVARSFGAAWVDHRDVSAAQWRDALRPLSTDELTARLAEVDPVAVPANRLTGEPTLTALSSNVVEARIGTDTGILRLRLVATAERWLVDGIDWERG